MNDPVPKGGNRITVGDLHSWDLLEEFRRRLGPVLADAPRSATEEDPRRTLHAEGYFTMMLFAMLNPVVRSMRGLCAASTLERVRQEVCGTRVSLGSFSDMQDVVDPELLAGLLRSLAQEALPVFGSKADRDSIGELIANDGTLLPALPRMLWALWQDDSHRAGKLHLEFSVWRQVPVEFTVGDANSSEREAWKAKLRKDVCYVNDRHYSHDYTLMAAVQEVGARFVMRLFNNTVIERLGPARELSEADRDACVVEDVKVRLGAQPGGPVGRLVRIEADGHTFLLFTNLEDIAAELVSQIYRHRWQIELFFKWIKCILGCRHWLAESKEGVTIQVYCALIASVLIALWTGRKPTKRQWEMLQFHWMGWASLEDVERTFAPKKSKH